MTGNVVLGVWLVGIVIFWLPSARVFLRVVGPERCEVGDYMVATFMGLSISMLWPLFAPSWIVYNRLRDQNEAKIREQ